MMRSRIFFTWLLAGLPWLVMAQSGDDLYFVPKKKAEVEKKEAAVSAEKAEAGGVGTYSLGATVDPGEGGGVRGVSR